MEIEQFCLPSLTTEETRSAVKKGLEFAEKHYPKQDELSGSNYTLPVVAGQNVDETDGQVVPCHETIKVVEPKELYSLADQNDEYVKDRQVLTNEEPESHEKQNGLGEDTLNEGKCLQQYNQTLSNLFIAEEKESHVTEFQWPALGIEEKSFENVIDKPELIRFFVGESNLCSEVVTSITSTSASTKHPQNTQEEHPLTNPTDDVEVVRVSKTKCVHPPSILKKDTKFSRKKDTAVHFPENIVSVRLYDVSDDEDSDSDTVILAGAEEDLVMDQQVPSDNSNESCSAEHSECISSSLLWNFTPQFSFPPVVKIPSYQIFNRPKHEQEPMNEIKEEEVTGFVKVNNEYARETDLQDVPRASGMELPEESMESDELDDKCVELCGYSITKETRLDATGHRLRSKHDGTLMHLRGSTEDSKSERHDNVKTDIRSCSEEKGFLCSTEPPECSEKPDAEVSSGIADVNEKEDAENKLDTASTPGQTRSGQTCPSGRCSEHLLWRAPRTIGSMLIKEGSQPSMMSAGRPVHIQPASILHSVTPEDVSYEGNIIDVVTKESKMFKLSPDDVHLSISIPTECHGSKPEKHIIQTFVSSPDHFNQFDVNWEPGLEGSPTKSKTEGNGENMSFVEAMLERHRTETENNPFKSEGSLKPETETTVNHPGHVDNERESFLATVFGEKHFERHAAFHCHTLLRENLSSSVKQHSTVLSGNTRPVPPQIVPEIEACDVVTSRKSQGHPDNVYVHAVPSTFEDVINVDRPFYSDDCPYKRSKISGEAKANLVQTTKTYAKQAQDNQGCNKKSTEPILYEKLKQRLLPFMEKLVEDFSRQKSNSSSSLTPVQEKSMLLNEDDKGSKSGRREIKEVKDEKRKLVNHDPVFKTSSEIRLLAKQGRRKLRVGLSKSTRVKPLHPYWSKNQIK